VKWRHAFTVFVAGPASGRGFVLFPDMTPSEGSTRRQLNDLPDAIGTKLRIEFYADPVDAVFKALAE
jgi:predicted ATP-dependent Lon-type protease